MISHICGLEVYATIELEIDRAYRAQNTADECVYHIR